MTPEILYEDSEIVVVYKPAGMESQSGKTFSMDLCSYLKNRLAAQGVKHPYIGVIHRLDRMVAGVMVYAKTKEAAANLSKQVQCGQVQKYYKALLCGRLSEPEGELTDALLQDVKKNYSAVVEPGTAGAKKAKLTYRQIGEEELDCVLKNLPSYVVSSLQFAHMAQVSVEENNIQKAADQADAAVCGQTAKKQFKNGSFVVSQNKNSMVQGAAMVTGVEIHLLTGRHHQIRVQFSHRGTPLWGDTKYNPAFLGMRTAGVALCACRLKFQHPRTGKLMEFSLP